jgi:hypothetical protein
MSERRTLAVAVFVVLLLAVAGCSAPRLPFSDADPPADRLGWENGYWYDETLDINESDGLNDSEREAVVARAMARIERIRGLEFESTVPVEVISRAEYRRRNDGSTNRSAHDRWNNQVWEALFVVGEDTDVSDAFSSTLGSSVQGYYSVGEDEIVVVSDAETPTLSRRTLAHELVHALQDQQFGLNGSADTQDAQLARNGIVEGDARYVEAAYVSRCGEQWECVDSGGGGGGGGGDYNRALFLTIYQPYATGPGFVAAVKDRGGWDAVDAVYSDPPDSSEQVIHPSLYPDEKPVNVTVPDRSNASWSRFDVSPVADTVGEASIYAMFVSNGVVEPQDRYGYNATPSAGWGGDALVPYQSDDGEYGYVWTTAWDSESDAREFEQAYLDLLERKGATERDGDVYVVDESNPYGDAFRVTRDGDRVRIVNAPTVADLDGVHDPA